MKILLLFLKSQIQPAIPKVPGTEYAEKTYSIEKYAKDVGLIYKDFIHWEYQGTDNTYKGFGEKLSIIDYN